MPYYDEIFVNRTAPQSARSTLRSTGTVKNDYNNVAVLDSVRMLSHRTRAHPRAIGRSKIVEDIQADPYAGFLRRTSEKQYREALEARGYKTAQSSFGSGAGAKKSVPDRGHAFELTRHTVLGQTKTGYSRDNYEDHVQSGVIPTFAPGIRHEVNNSVFRGGIDLKPIPYQETAGGLAAFAQSAYSRVAPTSEVFNAATFLGELREGLPRLVPEILQEAVKLHRVANRGKRPPRLGSLKGNYAVQGVGSDYLNVQFGWLPLISDVQNAATALARATVELAQEGRRVHRKYSLPSQTSSHLTQFGSNTVLEGNGGSVRGLVDQSDVLATMALGMTSQAWPSGPYTGTGSIHKMRRLDRWFEGSFSTFYRLGFDPSDYFDRLDALVNLDITPEVLWELAPWSWLVDWNLRLGDSIRANQLASDDRLVMHYGYAMETATYRSLHDIKHPDGTISGSSASRGWGTSSMTSVTTTYKKRLRANPYGFRVTTPSAFTGGQLGILGALGLTKL